jgi:hypothetical protein
MRARKNNLKLFLITKNRMQKMCFFKNFDSTKIEIQKTFSERDIALKHDEAMIAISFHLHC